MPRHGWPLLSLSQAIRTHDLVADDGAPFSSLSAFRQRGIPLCALPLVHFDTDWR
jgi:hypothetical protein